MENIETLFYQFISAKDDVNKIGLLKRYANINHLDYWDVVSDFQKYLYSYSDEMEAKKQKWISDIKMTFFGTDPENLNLEVNAKGNTSIKMQNGENYYLMDFIRDQRLVSDEFAEISLKRIDDFRKSHKPDITSIDTPDKKIPAKEKINGLLTPNLTDKNTETLKEYFNSDFKKAGSNNYNYFELSLLPDLKIPRTGKDFANIALFIYKCNKIEKFRPLGSFRAWSKQFCTLLGIKWIYYQQSKLKKPDNSLIETFSYLK